MMCPMMNNDHKNCTLCTELFEEGVQNTIRIAQVNALIDTDGAHFIDDEHCDECWSNLNEVSNEKH